VPEPSDDEAEFAEESAIGDGEAVEREVELLGQVEREKLRSLTLEDRLVRAPDESIRER
jgi:hypothetical protein